MKNKLKIIIAAHKKYDMPQDELYLPLQVGSFEKDSIGYTRDDDGENISNLNPNFCELTGLYWAWKNLKADYIGLVHYRRYFKGNLKTVFNGKIKPILSSEELNKKLKQTDVILPKKRHYYIESMYSHYKHTMFVEPLDEAGKIIAEKFPNYSDEFNKLKSKRSGHMFNMFVMKKSVLDKYCTWLFEILFELQKRSDDKQFDKFHARFYGRVSELLLDVWINTNKVKYREIPLINIEKINWWKKGTSFLKAKFFGTKYDKSF